MPLGLVRLDVFPYYEVHSQAGWTAKASGAQADPSTSVLARGLAAAYVHDEVDRLRDRRRGIHPVRPTSNKVGK